MADAFDVNLARAAGYTDLEIARYLRERKLNPAEQFFYARKPQPEPAEPDMEVTYQRGVPNIMNDPSLERVKGFRDEGGTFVGEQFKSATGEPIEVTRHPLGVPREAFVDPFKAGAEQVKEGVQKLREPSDTIAADPRWWDTKAGGLSDVIRGSAPFLMAAGGPAIAAVPAAAALPTVASLLGGGVAQAGAEHLAEGANIPPGMARLMGDVSGLAGGTLAGIGAHRLPSPRRALDLISTAEGEEGSVKLPGGSGPDSGPHGPIFRGFYHDAAGAVEQLKKAQTGEAPGALHHPHIGDIDLIWGRPGNPEKSFKDGFGLSHILAKHEEMRGHIGQLGEIIESLPVVPEARRSDEIRLENDRYFAKISRVWQPGKRQPRAPKTWLLTAFERKK